MNWTEARRIFREYAGDPWQMGRDGVWDTYKKFNVPEAREREWAAEYESELLLKIKISPVQGFAESSSALDRLLRRFKNKASILSLSTLATELSSTLDTFSRLLFAERLIELAGDLSPIETRESEERVELLKAATHLLHLCSSQEVTVDEYYTTLGYLSGDILADETLRQRIRRAQSELMKALDSRDSTSKPGWSDECRSAKRPGWKFW